MSILLQAPNKIGTLHEMKIQEDSKMGDNIEALYEDIDGRMYITFKNEQGEPLLIFPQREASIERIERFQDLKLQLLLKVLATHYILTFSSNDEARRFSEALLRCNVKLLVMSKVYSNIRERFKNNQIGIEPPDV